MEACLAGAQPDRPPVALWRHFPVDDQTPGGLAAAVVDFQKSYDFDFVKVTPASSFCIKDWGSQDRWEGNPEGTRAYTQHVIHQPEDWQKLKPLDPERGHLGAQLEALRMIRAEIPETPILQTIFSPLAQAKNLVGGDRLIIHLRRYPEAVLDGLRTITTSTVRFVEQALQTGIDGFFYAVQHAQFGLLTEQEYTRFGRQDDLEILAPAQRGWINLLHLHGEDIMFNLFQDYPVNVINWHDQETPPSLLAAQEKTSQVVCGGLRQWETMVLGTPDAIHTEARKAVEAIGGKRFVLGTGCVTPIIAPRGNILAARRAVEA
jgi:uroporphyrinogen decarboxylase